MGTWVRVPHSKCTTTTIRLSVRTLVKGKAAAAAATAATRVEAVEAGAAGISSSHSTGIVCEDGWHFKEEVVCVGSSNDGNTLHPI